MISIKATLDWAKRKFQPPVPEFVKHKTMLQYHIPKCTWIETGTYRGNSSKFLAQVASQVYTIEASKSLFDAASKKLARYKNITCLHGLSQANLKNILDKISGDVCFWLDAHFCGPKTFEKEKNCPILQELSIIFSFNNKFKNINILIDDIRDFQKNRQDYPDKLLIIQMADQYSFHWEIINDILIFTKKQNPC